MHMNSQVRVLSRNVFFGGGGVGGWEGGGKMVKGKCTLGEGLGPSFPLGNCYGGSFV